MKQQNLAITRCRLRALQVLIEEQFYLQEGLYDYVRRADDSALAHDVCELAVKAYALLDECVQIVALAEDWDWKRANNFMRGYVEQVVKGQERKAETEEE